MRKPGKCAMAALRSLIVTSLLGSCFSPGFSSAQTRVTSSENLNAYGKLPLTFEANIGQANPQVKFLTRSNGQVLFLSQRETILVLHESTPSAPAWKGPARKNRHGRSSVLRFRWVGGSAQANVQGDSLLATRSNYYSGNDASRWVSNVPHFGRVLYREVYPGVDVVFYGQEGKLEYDLVIQPGVRPDTIVMEIKGARRIRLDAQGNALLETGAGDVRLERPTIYQVLAGEKRPIRGGYVRIGKHRLGFQVEQYDARLPLVIDPTLSYTAHVQGNNATFARGIAVDASGNAVLVGETSATNLPMVAAAQPNTGGYTDVFVRKLNASGTGIIYSTYLGGNNFESAGGIAVDSNGNAYVIGTATSTDFPTTAGAFMRTCPTTYCNTPFAAKFSPSGALVYSTLLGGSNAGGIAVAADSTGIAYLTGLIASNDLPIVNAFQPTYGGTISTSSVNGFVQKLSADGSQILYSTYLGGAGETYARSIAVDGAGSAYVAGRTASLGFPLLNSFQPAAANASGFFITKFSPDGRSLAYSTVIPAVPGDYAVGVAVDGGGNAYMAGTTNSPDFPVTKAYSRTSCLAAINATCTVPWVFALKLNANGGSLGYSTFIGPGRAAGVAFDSTGRLHVTGLTASPSYPAVAPLQATLQQGASNPDTFIATLDATGDLVFSTFLGGAATIDEGSGLAADGSGNLYVAGTTAQSGYLLPAADFPDVGQQNSLCCGTLYSAFVAKISPSNNPAVSVSPRTGPVLFLRNVGGGSLTISSMTPASPGLSNYGCGTSLAAGASCAFSFASGTLTITSNAPGSPHTFTIGSPPGALNTTLLFSATTVEFSPQQLNTSAPSQVVTMRNLSFTAIGIQGVSLPAGFSQSNDCGGSLAGGGTCRFTIGFQPSIAGWSGGMLMIQTSAPGGVSGPFLAGFGSASSIVLSSAGVDFGPQYAGAAGLVRPVFVTNVSASPITISGVSATGEFSQTNTCSGPIAPQAGCRVAVSFVATGNGSRTGTLTVSHSGAGGARSASLSGLSMIHSELSVLPLELDFYTAFYGTTAGPQTVTLTNTGSAALSLVSYVPSSADFAQTNNCPASLSAGASCDVSITFTPSAVGDRSGTLSINHSGQGSPQVISIKAAARYTLMFNPTQFNFGDQLVGTTSPQQWLGISNLGYTDMDISNLTVTDPFQLVPNGCPAILPAHYGCGYWVVFAPTSTGPQSGAVTLVAVDSPSSHVIPLMGRGVGSGAASFTFNGIDFGFQALGSITTRTTRMTNSGTGPLAILQAVVTSGYSQTNNCPASLAAGAMCDFSAVFTPAVPGPYDGRMSIETDAPGSPHVVALYGVGSGPVLRLSASSYDFASQLLGTTSAAPTLTLSNTGDSPVQISSVSVTGDFTQSNNCATAVAAGSSCDVNIMFAPAAVGSRTGTLSITHNGFGSPAQVTLAGVGMDFAIGPMSGSSSSASVNAGQSATYQLSVAPNGFDGPITLSCAGAPAAATCSIAPNTFWLSGVPANTTITVTTTARAFVPSRPPQWWMFIRISPLGLFACLLFLFLFRLRFRLLSCRRTFLWPALVLLVLLTPGCGGGGTGGTSGPPPPPPQPIGTPAGTYVLSVTASAGTTASRTITLTLQVN